MSFDITGAINLKNVSQHAMEVVYNSETSSKLVIYKDIYVNQKTHASICILQQFPLLHSMKIGRRRTLR